MIEVQPVPPRLVDERGEVTLGVFDGLCRNPNLEEARLAWGPLALPRCLRRLRLKEWQHFGLILPDLFLGLAVVNAGLLRTSWCFVVDRTTDRCFEHKRTGVALDLQVARELWQGATWIRARGYRAEIQNRLAAGEHLLNLQIAAASGRPAVQGSLRCLHDLDRNHPLEVALPVGPGRVMYSHKVALPLEGDLRVGERTYHADGKSCYALLDIHRALYPWHTFWNWATLAGRDGAGRMVALNLTRNPNREDARYNENALWLEGELRHLGPAIFEFDPEAVLQPWRLRTRGGEVDLRFTPRGERQENLRLGLIRSVFHQLHGTFDGEVRFDDEVIQLRSVFGLCEDHDSLW